MLAYGIISWLPLLAPLPHISISIIIIMSLL